MDSVSENVQQVFTKAVNYLFIALTWVVPVVFRFAQAHPTITNFFGYLLAAYISWKVLCHLWVLVKRILIVMAIIFSFLLWYRGLHQVLSVDLPVLQQHITNDPNLQKWWSCMLNRLSPARLGSYSAVVLLQQLYQLRDRSLRFLASLSN